ncbi:metallophosphoesterase family protein [Listeria grandensis]|uniref:metallophosphoesterase family protein n=1 Tax=Listeria grandensis TaxID=1494963 RepID=UPI00164DB192|nr:metallophosphoesterase family protein [Listeria grandensis]MBC6315602.1 metallophosphoesterase [Listeria grandensis]
MKHKIALLADVHGNTTALQAVIEDSIEQGATAYWFLGDLLLPGPGSSDLLKLLKQVHTDVYIRGNWEDYFLHSISEEIDITDPTAIYLATLAHHIYPKMTLQDIQTLKSWPISTVKEVSGLKIGISHNLPCHNNGDFLFPTKKQKNFDALFTDNTLDIAIYAHVHHPMLRYSSQEQLIINPGSIGQPLCNWPPLQMDLRAQYAILEIDAYGYTHIDFRKVDYDRQKELLIAQKSRLPYIDLYQEILQIGVRHTHDKELLEEINDYYGYKKRVSRMFT